MSFFGFDPSQQPRSQQIADFEEDDAFNDETFGSAAVSSLNTDFNFGFGQQQQSESSLKPAPQPQKSSMSYAAATHTVDDVLKPMESLWTESEVQQKNDSVFSNTEIEAKLSAPVVSQPPVQQQQLHQQQSLPPVMPQQGFPFPPQIAQALMQPHIQQHIMASVQQGRFPNPQTAMHAMIQLMMANPQMMAPLPPGFAPSPIGGQMPPPPPPPQMQQRQPSQPPQQQLQPQQQLESQQQLVSPQQYEPSQSSAQQQQEQSIKVDLNSMPSLAEAKSVLGQHTGSINNGSPQPEEQLHAHNYQNQNQQHSHHHNNQRQYNNHHNHHHNNNNNRHYQSHHQKQLQHQQLMQQQLEQMTPEEKEKFFIRQHKVAKITRASGFMTPKDKDFVTRFQLSQIVTEDPFNEDFYHQVFKILHSSINENDMNSLAQKYLDQSGHRLGGRSKRADIALQRMQQQVSKAVSVAKERGERSLVLSKDGALGKVSFGNGKAPRKQLTISKEESIENSDALPKQLAFSTSSRSFQLSIIEKIIDNVLKFESQEREKENVDVNDLWKSLHLNDTIKTSDDETINPFISVLSFEKMMKVFGRIFNFLTADQKSTIVGLILSNFQKLDVIIKSSYRNYADNNYEIPKDVSKKIAMFESTIFKTILYHLSETDFTTVLSILHSMIENNNILFVCTTKLGLQLLTFLVSRLELAKQDETNILAQTERAQWTAVYHELFQSLEGRLALLFPPYLSHNESIHVENSHSEEDDSYIWQFLASLTLAGLLNHQRVIIDEVRDEIFGVQTTAQGFIQKGEIEKSSRLLENLNFFLNVMGLKATETELGEME
ncbi:Pat1 protein [Martiniozyma asiatica (nom. inval.)]|nr:Pat1 protein [Martiniozyma asiatica]